MIKREMVRLLAADYGFVVEDMYHSRIIHGETGCTLRHQTLERIVELFDGVGLQDLAKGVDTESKKTKLQLIDALYCRAYLDFNTWEMEHIRKEKFVVLYRLFCLD